MHIAQGISLYNTVCCCLECHHRNTAVTEANTDTWLRRMCTHTVQNIYTFVQTGKLQNYTKDVGARSPPRY